jgi:anhydro-N-acetylmuramic acid kinase
MTDELVIGMLSGTSRDGVDAVLVNFSKESMDLLHAVCTPYPPAIKLTLDQVLETGRPPGNDVAVLLDENLGCFFARVAQNLAREAGVEMRDIKVIGCHGQNIWHEPGGSNPVAIQLGNGDIIARNTGTKVVTDFRSADVEAGGQGTPLAPLLHQHLFHDAAEDRAILNIGGIANLTLLPCNGNVSGFDTGPGNCLMDAWTRRHLRKNCDNNGNWAAKGELNKPLLKRMLQDPYFEQAPPKSTGLEYFNMSWLENIPGSSDTEAGNLQTTLAELTAQSVRLSLDNTGHPARLLVCGGGAHNIFLISRLAAALPAVVVETTARHRADPDWVEGLLFAWLARERLAERVQNTPPVTGANRPVLLGTVFEP